ncbi:MAG: hypothetical protein MUE41_13735 [Gemmatimonadaceae bacterium]|jgi:uncharacterized membrane protein|nr:hypothetical protein [Gemmatimonadaceae bacterium]
MPHVRALLAALVVVATACGDRSVGDTLAPVEPSATPALCCGGNPSPWSVTTLTLPTGTWTASAATGINDSGVVVGFVTVSGAQRRPVRWTNGVPAFLVVTTPQHWALANAINNGGDIVGQMQWISGNASQPVKPVRWLNPGTVQTLATLGWDGWAIDINSSRVAVGTSRATSGGQQRAVKWSANGTITNLHPAGATWSRAQGINEQGEIVGVVDFGGSVHGWKWKPDNSSIDLGIVLNATVPEINSTSEAIGTAVFLGVSQAVVWTPNGTPTGAQAGLGSIGTSISDGRRSIGVSGSTAWTWRFEASATTLPSPTGAGFSHVRDVNRCGTIVGHAGGGTLAMQVPVRWSKSVCDP